MLESSLKMLRPELERTSKLLIELWNSKEKDQVSLKLLSRTMTTGSQIETFSSS